VSVVLVTGGTGTLGTKLVSRLRERDHDVRVLSRRRGAGTHRADLGTGEGVADATAGAELVIHAASDTRHRGRSDLAQTRHLLSAAHDATHLLYVSIVGIDKIPFSYYKAKLACEREIEAAAVSHTILRATQFHELLASALESAERLPVAPLPLEWRFQTVAADEVAARVVELLEREPLGRAPDFGGPQVQRAREMVGSWRELRGRPRRVLNVRLPGRVSRSFREGLNTCPAHADGHQTWPDFLSTL
jgi:uncharacterized protein YbjT (DUF2867 family)